LLAIDVEVDDAHLVVPLAATAETVATGNPECGFGVGDVDKLGTGEPRLGRGFFFRP
jgi:hypothetical protein